MRKKKRKCIEKKRYPTLGSAYRAMQVMHLKGRKVYGLYECPICLDFHITHLYDNRPEWLKREMRSEQEKRAERELVKAKRKEKQKREGPSKARKKLIAVLANIILKKSGIYPAKKIKIKPTFWPISEQKKFWEQRKNETHTVQS